MPRQHVQKFAVIAWTQVGILQNELLPDLRSDEKL